MTISKYKVRRQKYIIFRHYDSLTENPKEQTQTLQEVMRGPSKG